MDTTSDAQIVRQQESCASAATNSAHADMQASIKLDEDCAKDPKDPMGRAIRLIGDAWVLLIVINLLSGTRRFNELLEVMGRISSKTLSQRLKGLEEWGIVERQAFYEIPPRVEYSLTEKGRDLGAIIGAIEQFAYKHLSTVKEPPCDA